MTEQQEPAPEPDTSGEFVGEPPAGDAHPGAYMSNDQRGVVSEDTGTTYDQTGEPESTPHDEELLAEEDEE